MRNKNIIKQLLSLLLLAAFNQGIYAQILSDTLIVKESNPFTTDKYSLSAKSSVAGNNIRGQAESSLSNLLSGRIAGLTVMHSSGLPGENTPQVFIRGKSTYMGTDILVYVDGFESSLDFLVPEEIEKITVLKDAVALAPYGIRGANGVILVETKRGQSGSLKIGVGVKTGLSNPINKLDFLDSYGYASLYNEAISNDLGKWSPYYTDDELAIYKNGSDPSFYPNVNWLDEVLKSQTHFEEANISLQGGGSNVNYYTMVNFTNTPQLFQTNNNSFAKSIKSVNAYTKLNVRGNIDVKINDIFGIKVNMGGAVLNIDAPNSSKIFTLTNSLPPNAFPVTNIDGSWAASPTYPDNPLAELHGTGKKNYHKRYLQSDLVLRQDLSQFIKGLSFSEGISFWGYGNTEDITTKDYQRYQMTRNDQGEVATNLIGGSNPEFDLSQSLKDQTTRLSIDLKANYMRNFDKHHLDASIAYMYSKYTISGNNLAYLNAGLYGNVKYMFDSRYLAEFAYAYNGSENLPNNNKYGFFPSMALGWIVSEENFFNVPSIDLLKVRISGGMVGNSDLGSTRFGYQTYYNSSTKLNLGSAANSSISSLIEGKLGNPYISYEKNYKYNFGLETRILKKISIAFDLFYEKRKGILATNESKVPAIVGINLPYENIGEVSNKGFEVELTHNNRINDFSYTIGGNIAFAKNKIDYQAEVLRSENYLYRTGRPVGQQFALEAIGFFNSWEEINDAQTPVHSFAQVQPGDVRYKDQNGDGIINEDDLIAMGYSSIPQISGGLNLGLSYKNFDLIADFYGMANRSTMLSGNLVWAFYNNGQVPEMALDRWAYYPDRGIDTRSSAKYPRLTVADNNNNNRASSLWMRDISFFRLQNMELGYNFSKSVTSKLFMKQLRVYLQGTNLLTYSTMKEFDPEVYSGYPMVRSFSIGLKAQF